MRRESEKALKAIHQFLEDNGAAFTVSANVPKSEKEKAYEELCQMIHSIPDLVYDRELAEYREKKYGK